MTDQDGVPRARLRRSGTGHGLEVLRAGAWRAIRTLGDEEFQVELLGVSPDDRGLWVLSGDGRDRRALLRVDLETGKDTVVHSDPRVDVEWARVSERTRSPLVVSVNPDYPRETVFDPELASALAPLKRRGPTNLWILSLDDAERRMTVQAGTDKGYESYLVERGGGEPLLLGRSSSMAFADTLGALGTLANLPDGRRTATIESKTNFFAAVLQGDTAHAVCMPLHRGRTTIVLETRITRGDGKLAAIVTQTQLIFDDNDTSE